MSLRTTGLALTAAVALTLVPAPAVSSTAEPVPEDAAPQGLRWTELTPASGRAWSASGYHAKSDQVVVFGGNEGGGGGTQTWVFDGESWTILDLAVHPDFRLNAAMAYDRVREEMVLFGGTCDCGGLRYGDTWVFDGAHWTERQPDTSPPEMYGSRMAYDPRARKVVMFGGRSEDGVSDETWVWDGTTWSIRHPAVSPPARFAAGMAYSRRLGGIVLFGGQTDDAERFADTWLWKDGTWTELADAFDGAPRAGVGMASMGRRVVMVGGYPTGGAETWVLGRDTWHRLASDDGPATRYAPAIAYDSTRRRVVMSGGGSESGDDPQDTWVLQRR